MAEKKPTRIRLADFTSQEDYAAALSQAATPLVSEVEDDFEDDDALLFAIVRMLH